MIEFILNNRLLAAISIHGLTINEIEETRNLLAYENNVEPGEIKVNVL